MMTKTKYVAMWSGPRNISTAMMRSWGNRSDTFVCDEPLYAHYLHETKLDHPGRELVMASQPRNWQEVVSWLTGPIPEGKSVFYQKHMTHHLLPQIGRDWLGSVSNAFLIRDPKDMLTSLAKVLSKVRLADTGIPQQWEIFELVRKKSRPIVVDARDVQNHPELVLPKLCEALELPFESSMLSWPVGPRQTDGVWAPFWYANVEKSTCFEPYQPKSEVVSEELFPILEECQKIYDEMVKYRITS